MRKESGNRDEPKGLDPEEQDEAEKLIAKLRRHSRSAKELADAMKKKLLPGKTTATLSHMMAIRTSSQFRKALCEVRTGIRLLTRPPPAHPPPA